jgi:hypothetical protein
MKKREGKNKRRKEEIMKGGKHKERNKQTIKYIEKDAHKQLSGGHIMTLFHIQRLHSAE